MLPARLIVFLVEFAVTLGFAGFIVALTLLPALPALSLAALTLPALALGAADLTAASFALAPATTAAALRPATCAATALST